MAAIALDFSGPYDGTDHQLVYAQWRTLTSIFATDGVVRGALNGFAASAPGGRFIALDTGRGFVQGTYGDSTSTETLSFAANASGNARIDLIVLRNNFTGKQLELDVLQGTPSGSPVPPAVTRNTTKWEIGLFQVACANGFTNLTIGNVTNVIPYTQGKPPGGPLTVGCRASCQAGTTISGATFQFINFDTEIYDPYAMHTNPGGTFVIPIAGLWTTSCVARWGGTTNMDTAIRLNQNGTFPDGTTFAATPPIVNTLNSLNQGYVDLLPCAAGDVMQWEASQDHGSAVNIISAAASFRYLGPSS